MANRQSRKADGRPSFQFYPDDWLSEPGLRLCDLSARGLWIDLLCFMFGMEERGSLVQNGRILTSREVSNLVGRPQAEVKQAIEQLVEHCVCETADDGRIYSRRMTRDEKQRLSKVEAGRKGGRSRKLSKRQAKGGSPSPSPSPSPSSSSSSPPNPLVQNGFERFWEAYPRKQAKAKARQIWSRLKSDDDLLETMLDAIAKWRLTDQWQKDGGIYIPMPSTWLNQKRWQDEPPKSKEQERQERFDKSLGRIP